MVKRLLFFISIIVLFLTPVTCFAANHNWQWVSSNDKYGYFLDTNTIRLQKNGYGRAIKASVWMKVKYTYQGAISEIDYFNANISPSTLQDGESINELNIDLIHGEIDVNRVALYDKNGNILYTNNKTTQTDVIHAGFFSPIYNYLISYISGCEAMEIYLNKDTFKLKNDFEYYVPIYLAYKDGNNIRFIIYNKDNDKTFIMYCESNMTNHTSRISALGTSVRLSDQIYTDEKFEAVIPGTPLDSIINSVNDVLIQYPKFANRFKNGGLEIRPDLNL